jgi:hypothetical protein
MNDADSIPVYSSRDEIVPGALADCVKIRPSVSPGERTLGSPDRRCNGPGSLSERSGAEEMRNDGAERQFGARGEKQRKLVDVLDQNVRAASRDSPVHCRTSE